VLVNDPPERRPPWDGGLELAAAATRQQDELMQRVARLGQPSWLPAQFWSQPAGRGQRGHRPSRKQTLQDYPALRAFVASARDLRRENPRWSWVRIAGELSAQNPLANDGYQSDSDQRAERVVAQQLKRWVDALNELEAEKGSV
jgi:hypothetical protein